jgi:hypothetical protein
MPPTNEPPFICRHVRISLLEGTSAGAEPPYDEGDFWWVRTCDDCDATVGEGDGYDYPE